MFIAATAAGAAGSGVGGSAGAAGSAGGGGVGGGSKCSATSRFNCCCLLEESQAEKL